MRRVNPNMPVDTEYKGLTDKFIYGLIDNDTQVQQTKDGKVGRFYLYNDETNPMNQEKESRELWSKYFDKVKRLSMLSVKKL